MMKIVKVTTSLKPIGDFRSPSTNKTRIYFWLDKESVIEGLFKRRSRPHLQYAKFIPEVMKFEVISSDMKKVYHFHPRYRWSQSAGCKVCPCSPGFIMGFIGSHDIHVTYSE
jgi:hypothetical protein